MSIRSRATPIVFWGSLCLGLLLSLVAMPEVLRPLRPFWIGLLLVYWSLEMPERVGLGLAFLVGLVADLLSGSLLGEQALRLAILVFVVLRLRSRMRFFPMLQQVLMVLGLLINDRVVMLMVRVFSGESVHGWSFWVAPVLGALLWPWLFLAMDLVRQRTRLADP